VGRADFAAGWAWLRSPLALAQQRSIGHWSEDFAHRGVSWRQDAMANRFSVVRQDGSIQKFPTGKTIGHVVSTSERASWSKSAAVGVSGVLERDPERVLNDVRSDTYRSKRPGGLCVIIHQQGRRFELECRGDEYITAASGRAWFSDCLGAASS